MNASDTSCVRPIIRILAVKDLIVYMIMEALVGINGVETNQARMGCSTPIPPAK